MRSFRDKVVVISGAGSGIGRALAQAFGAEGAQLALNDIDAEGLEGTCALLPANARVSRAVLDVADRDAMFSFAARIVEEFGHVDVVFNNAGIGMGDQEFHHIDLALFDRVMEVNFQGVLNGSSAFVPHLLQRPEAALVNVSSIFGLTGIGLSAAYCASKFAVHGLNQALYQEYRGTALTIHSVHPGGVDTSIARKAIGPSTYNEAFHRKFLKMPPERAARTILAGIRKKKHRILIGGEAYALDLAVRLMPRLGGTLVNAIIRHQVNAAQRETTT